MEAYLYRVNKSKAHALIIYVLQTMPQYNIFYKIQSSDICTICTMEVSKH
jgi:hypothetical protein